jgi:hypothetical protein
LRYREARSNPGWLWSRIGLPRDFALVHAIAGFVLMLRPVALSLMAVGLTHLASNICFGFSK